MLQTIPVCILSEGSLHCGAYIIPMLSLPHSKCLQESSGHEHHTLSGNGAGTAKEEKGSLVSQARKPAPIPSLRHCL